MKTNHQSRLKNGKECRCCCGSLLACLKSEGIEIKCRRCKHFCLLKFSEPMLMQALKIYHQKNSFFKGNKDRSFLFLDS